MATASIQLDNNPADDTTKNFTIYPAESLTDAIKRESYEKRDSTLPFGFYYGSFATLVPSLFNGDVFGVNDEALSRMLAPTLSTSLGLFMLAHLVGASSIVSFFTKPIRQLMGTQRPFLRRLVVFLLTLFAGPMNTFGQSALSRPISFQLSAPGITIDRSVTTPGFNLDIPATTISYSVDLIRDRPLKTLQVFVDALVDELRHPGVLGFVKATSTRKVRSAVETVEWRKMAMNQTIPLNTSSIMPSADSPATSDDELMIENRKRMHDLAWQVRKEIFENGPCPVNSMPSSLTSVSNSGLGRRGRHLFAKLLLGTARPPAERSKIDTNDERVRKLCADAANALTKYLRLVKRRRLPAAGEQY